MIHRTRLLQNSLSQNIDAHHPSPPPEEKLSAGWVSFRVEERSRRLLSTERGEYLEEHRGQVPFLNGCAERIE